MYMYIYREIYIHIDIHTYVYIYIYRERCIHTYIYIYIYIYMYIYMYAYIAGCALGCPAWWTAARSRRSMATCSAVGHSNSRFAVGNSAAVTWIGYAARNIGVCVCVCMYVYIYIYIVIYTHTHTHIHRCMCMYMYRSMHMCMYTYIYIYIYTHTHCWIRATHVARTSRCCGTARYAATLCHATRHQQRKPIRGILELAQGAFAAHSNGSRHWGRVRCRGCDTGC